MHTIFNSLYLYHTDDSALFNLSLISQTHSDLCTGGHIKVVLYCVTAVPHRFLAFQLRFLTHSLQTFHHTFMCRSHQTIHAVEGENGPPLSSLFYIFSVFILHYPPPSSFPLPFSLFCITLIPLVSLEGMQNVCEGPSALGAYLLCSPIH